MPLDQRLDQIRSRFVSRMPSDKLAVMQLAESRLRASGIIGRALRPGNLAPQFRLCSQHGRPVALTEALARGPVILTFVQGSWSAFCRMELAAYQRMLPYATALGATVIAVSPQTAAENCRLAAELELSFDLVSDPGNGVAWSFGLQYKLPPTMRDVYEQLGFDLPRHNGTADWELPLPATYVVRPDGLIEAGFVDTDVTRRMEPMEALQVVADLVDSRRRPVGARVD